MGTTAEKLAYLQDTKNAIKTKLIEKGVAVSDTDTFRSYADKIGEIIGESSSGEGGAIPTDGWITLARTQTITPTYSQSDGCYVATFNAIRHPDCNYMNAPMRICFDEVVYYLSYGFYTVTFPDAVETSPLYGNYLLEGAGNCRMRPKLSSFDMEFKQTSLTDEPFLLGGISLTSTEPTGRFYLDNDKSHTIKVEVIPHGIGELTEGGSGDGSSTDDWIPLIAEQTISPKYSSSDGCYIATVTLLTNVSQVSDNGTIYKVYCDGICYPVGRSGNAVKVLTGGLAGQTVIVNGAGKHTIRTLLYAQDINFVASDYIGKEPFCMVTKTGGTADFLFSDDSTHTIKVEFMPRYGLTI